MKLTLKKYEQAKKIVADAKAQQEVINTWDDAMKKLGDLGNQRVVAMTIKDGKITTECELDETASRPILKADQEKSPFEKAGKK